MYRQTGIVAGLASLALIAIAADPACADPGPILPLPTIVSIDVLPEGNSTTSATSATETGAGQTGNTTTKTAPKTGETSTVRTRSTGSTGGAAQRGTAASPTPSPRPTLPTAPPEPSPYAAPQAASPSSGQAGQHDRWFDLAMLVIVALLAVGLGRRHRKSHAEVLVDRAACLPEFADPEGVARQRLRSVN